MQKQTRRQVLHRTNPGDWSVLVLFYLIFLFGLAAVSWNVVEAHPKNLFSPDALASALFAGAVFLGVPFLMFGTFSLNWLSEVSCDQEGFRLKGLFLEKDVSWKDLEKVEVYVTRSYYIFYETVNLRIRYSGGKTLKFSSVFGPIGNHIFEKIKEFRPDLVRAKGKSKRV